MKTAAEKEFIRCMHRRSPMLEDGVVALVPRQYAASVSQIDGAKSMIFQVVDQASGRVAGELALRLGDGPGLFYLGHIGYHIDPPYRGKNEALHACRLCLPLIAGLFGRSFVITTDDDNLPSIRTCERLGCVLESKVQVPLWCVQEYGISTFKRRYIYEARP